MHTTTTIEKTYVQKSLENLETSDEIQLHANPLPHHKAYIKYLGRCCFIIRFTKTRNMPVSQSVSTATVLAAKHTNNTSQHAFYQLSDEF